MGLSVLALGEFQTHQDELVALLDGVIRENPFVTALFQDPLICQEEKQLTAGLSSISQEGD